MKRIKCPECGDMWAISRVSRTINCHCGSEIQITEEMRNRAEEEKPTPLPQKNEAPKSEASPAPKETESSDDASNSKDEDVLRYKVRVSNESQDEYERISRMASTEGSALLRKAEVVFASGSVSLRVKLDSGEYKFSKGISVSQIEQIAYNDWGPPILSQIAAPMINGAITGGIFAAVVFFLSREKTDLEFFPFFFMVAGVMSILTLLVNLGKLSIKEGCGVTILGKSREGLHFLVEESAISGIKKWAASKNIEVKKS